MNKLFNYYEAIIPEKARWHSVCSNPLKTCLWANTLKISPDDLKKSLEKEGCDLEPVAWNASAFRCNQKGMGVHWQYAAGLFQIQEEVSMLPVHFLEVAKDDRVLDLCAAPGNKTAQIAVLLNNRGTVIANDKNYQRMKAFGQISKRLGLMNVTTSIYDGRAYPRLKGYFDKVIVDAPCSAEGVFRKGNGKDIEPNPKNSLRLQRIQITLLEKAIQSCRPGGRIVYSTCTFSPLENEAVIDAILKTHDNVVVKSIALDHFQLSSGITSWEGAQYSDEVKKTARIWPHLNDTGGFYIAVLEKIGGEEYHFESKPPFVLNETIQYRLDEVCQRFGIPESVFCDFSFSDDTSRGIYCINSDNTPPPIAWDAAGLFFIKTRINFPKLSTAAAMVFGKYARKNRIELTREQLDAFLQKNDVALDSEQVALCTDTGYVVCFYEGHSIGLGLYFEPRDDRGPVLRSLFPRYLV